MESVEMIPELVDYLRLCIDYRNADLERQLQKLLDFGVPRERLLIRARTDRHGYVYDVHVKTDSEVWLDWLSENH